MTDRLTILHGDVLARLVDLADASVHCVVTSPPYYSLRDYQTAQWEGGREDCDHKQPLGDGSRHHDPAYEVPFRTGANYVHQKLFHATCLRCGARRIDQQIGLEAQLDCLGWATGDKCDKCWICRLTAVFAEVWRVLREDGTCWINCGDSYAGNAQSDSFRPGIGRADGKVDGRGIRNRNGSSCPDGLKPKDLCLQPFRLALALQAQGWYVRSISPWVKRSAMPSSVKDRPSEALEYMILLAKSPSYYWDADAVRRNTGSQMCEEEYARKTTPGATWKSGGVTRYAGMNKKDGGQSHPNGRNLRNSDFWFDSMGMLLRDEILGFDVNPEPLRESHYAAFPSALVKPCVLAGTSEAGCCPQCQAPWRRVVERVSATNPAGYNGSTFTNGKTAAPRPNVGQGTRYENGGTVGWQASCTCPGVTENDLQPAVVLDPFAGSGTTGMVALELGRRAILIELNADYIALIRKRCAPALAQELLPL